MVLWSRGSAKQRPYGIHLINRVKVQGMERGKSFRNFRSAHRSAFFLRFGGVSPMKDKEPGLTRMKLRSLVPQDVPAARKSNHDLFLCVAAFMHFFYLDHGFPPQGIMFARGERLC